MLCYDTDSHDSRRSSVSRTVVIPVAQHSETTPLLEHAFEGENTSALPTADGPTGDGAVVPKPNDLRLRLILGSAYLGVFLGAIDISLLTTLSAPIASEFRALSLMSWLATAYLIANAAFQPISGKLTDIFGRGPGLALSNLVFACGNLICGLSRNMWIMILGRVISGIGGGGLLSIPAFLATDLVPLRKRGIIQGVVNIAYGSGAMCGGVFGGLVYNLSSTGWRLAFLIQVPPALISAGLAAYLIQTPKSSNQSTKLLLANIDTVGAFLLVLFLSLLLIGLSTGGNIVPWNHPLPLTTIPLSAVTAIAFIIRESRASQPIIPVKLLLRRTVLGACVTNLFGTMGSYLALYYVQLYLQVRGYSAVQAGLTTLIAPIGISIGSLGSGHLMRMTGRYVALGIAAAGLQLAQGAILCTLDDQSPRWPIVLSFLLQGVSYGAMLTVALLACVAAVDHAHHSTVTGATYAFRSVGGTLGITIASVVYQNLLQEGLWSHFGNQPGAGTEISKLLEDLNELQRLPPTWPKSAVIGVFIDAFRGVWLITIIIGFCSLGAVSLMKQHVLYSTLNRREQD